MSSDRVCFEEGIQLDAPPERVWELVGNFARVDAWTLDLTVLDASGSEPGSIRQLRSGAHRLREQLVSREPDDMTLRYCLLEGGLPARDYVSELAVETVGPAACRVRWSASCTPVGISAARLEGGLRKAYRRNLEHLADLLATRP